MPRKLPQGRAATADRVAVLIRTYRAAVRSGDEVLRLAASDELHRKHGLRTADLFESLPELTEKGVKNDPRI